MEKELPEATLEDAMRRQAELHERRIRIMYNRHRALFAESLVAELLGGEEVIDPSAAWDVTWAPTDSPVLRIQVKCSGGFLPRNPDKERVAPAAWSIDLPTRGWDPDGPSDLLWNLGGGHHCDVFVLARHVGTELGAGWSFAAVPVALIAEARVPSGKPRTRFTLTHLKDWGVEMVSPTQLPAAVLGSAGRAF